MTAAVETSPKRARRRAKHLPASAPASVEVTRGSGAPFSEADAPLIQREIAALVAVKGWTTQEEIYEYARTHNESALHRNIEWNRDRAARKFQVFQIANICRYLKYNIEKGGVVYQEKIWEHVRVTKESGHPAAPGYVILPRVDVLETPSLRQELEQRAVRELKAWQDRYEKLQRISSPEFRFIYDAIRQFEAMLAR